MDDEPANGSGATNGVDERRFRAPDPLRMALEQWAVVELGAFLAASPFLRALGRGDRHPVLVLPGFTASDTSTVPLRWFLRGQGYWVHGWRLGRNFGPTQAIVDGVTERLAWLHEHHEARVSLIGWSLGGIFARELARAQPHAVRQVITLGTPFRMRPGDHSSAEPLYERLRRRHVVLAQDGHLPEDDRPPLKVPSTAIYSRADGVVRWNACIDAAGPNRENIEVRGSHSGLGVNPAVLVAVADRLAQPEGLWEPFQPPAGTGFLFPRPAVYEPAVRVR